MTDLKSMQEQIKAEASKRRVIQDGLEKVADVMDYLGPIMGWDEMYAWYDEAMPDDADWVQMLEIAEAKRRSVDGGLIIEAKNDYGLGD